MTQESEWYRFYSVLNMNYSEQVKLAMSAMSLEKATAVASELQQSIEARSNNRICACGTPCRNPRIHDAIDRLTLAEIEQSLAVR